MTTVCLLLLPATALGALALASAWHGWGHPRPTG